MPVTIQSLTQADINSSSKLAAIIGDATGSGVFVRGTSPTFTTPNIGAATATSLNSSGTVYGTSFLQSPATQTGIANFTSQSIYYIGGGQCVITSQLAQNVRVAIKTGGSASYDPSLIYGVATKTLTESTATAFIQIACANNSTVSGVIHFTVRANDATERQARSGSLPFSIVNISGTETVTFGTVYGDVAGLSSGTLTVTFDYSNSPTNAVLIRANAVSSLTQTLLEIDHRTELYRNTASVTYQ